MSELKKIKKESNLSLWLFLIIMLLCLGVGYWSYVTEVEQVIRAEAKIVPENEVYSVQNRYAGTVIKANIKLGKEVKKGDILYEIDPEETSTKLTKAKYSLINVQAQISRLNAQINNSEPIFKEDIPNEIKMKQIDLLYSLRQSLNKQQEVLNEEIKGLNVTIKEYKMSSMNNQRQLALVLEEIDLISPLIKSGAAPKIKLIEAQKQYNSINEKISNYSFLIEKAKIEILSKKKKIEQIYLEFLSKSKEELLNSLSELELYILEVQELNDIKNRSFVLSKENGIITAVNNFSVGEIIEAGTILAELVPSETEYIVEAKLLPKDSGKLVQGQKARLSLASYDFTDYGHIDTLVYEIAKNTTIQNNGEEFYKILLEFENYNFSKSGQPVFLLPGMPGQIEIISSKNTVIDYILKPIQKLSNRALTEE